MRIIQCTVQIQIAIDLKVFRIYFTLNIICYMLLTYERTRLKNFNFFLSVISRRIAYDLRYLDTALCTSKIYAGTVPCTDIVD